MRRTIRSQILVPVISVQVVTVLTIAFVAARISARRSEEQITGQLDGIIATLNQSSFPYTAGVLRTMRGLTGAHFIVTSTDGGAVVATTFDGLDSIPPSLRELQSLPTFRPPGNSPPLLLDGERYLAASVRPVASDRGSRILVLYPETAWQRARWEAAMPPIVVGFVSLVPMTLITCYVAQRLGGRLRSIERRVASIAGGDFQDLEPGGQRDEVQDLVLSVNRMCSQLREMRNEIRRSERAGLLGQLAAGLAHQLRNAATGARMAVQLHARRCTQDGPDRSLDVALRQLSISETQVRSLLALGRREHHERTVCDPDPLIGEIVDLVEPACQHARVELSRRTQAGLRIEAHVESLRGAILNLTLNAIEAAGSGGQVRVETGNGDGSVHIDVFDSGPGPPSELAESLFEPFITGKREGVGLGLALARQVAVEHGGCLTWSREENFTRFRLSLPAPASFPEVEEQA